ncbi:competence/damage-inducible protein A [Alkaliphilus crotonatoxidans]
MKASIICVGTELVTGKTIETNSNYIAKELRQYGIYTYQKLVVEDHEGHLAVLLEIACKDSDCVILTGGLGPTLDDLTREAVAAYTGYPLELNHIVKEKIKQTLERIHQACPVNNYRQAYFPRGAHILENHHGTAPGFIVDYQKTKIIALPGPPKEMIPMLKDQVIPYLSDVRGLVFVKRELEFIGIGESALEEKLMDLIEGQVNPVMATYAAEGRVSLVITARAETQEAGEMLLAPVIQEVKGRVGVYIFSETGQALEEVIQALLNEKALTLAVAESCSGGLLSARLTALPGISTVFHSGYVTYSNEAKIKTLAVPADTLNQYGAVSPEIALAMLKGLKERTGAHCGLSVTGIAGPGGGTVQKPVGLVYVGVNVLDDYQVFELRLRGERSRIQNLTVLYSLNYLRKALQKIK